MVQPISNKYVEMAKADTEPSFLKTIAKTLDQVEKDINLAISLMTPPTLDLSVYHVREKLVHTSANYLEALSEILRAETHLIKQLDPAAKEELLKRVDALLHKIGTEYYGVKVVVQS